ncbi:sushi, von Willebrand factor type A, EGF and pentraxin domain-containing protein 1 isoform X2 [Hyalella azteca]|uniref:Sushi, von Willebrand factor type A, EGF and pentraxin domain-containing protein 1 isoform X2 n=1 Tax=Hyalella azteca TaxID=294128 RepID=A0A8B7NJH2_HYAAZ|nr:sushi, von Willebrand factor type A, EGF and pentraxin domain-containing protein 1 isoform X2 [Hyalella azteca]
MKSPVMFEGLLLRWAGYDRVEGNVERVGPSNCGQHVCPLGYTGDCTVLQRDKTPPRVDHCPGHIWVITKNGSAVVNWDRPRFTDNIGIEKTIEKSGYFPGQAFALGTYHIATVAYDAAGNSATCSFNVYVLEDFCEDLADPVGGTQRCSNWGPGGRFKVCSIECNPGLKFSTQVPDFYTCGAEGFWRPTTDPSIPLVYPACSQASPAQRVFKINMQFPSSVICNAAGQNVLSERIRVALMKLNREWNLCTETDSSTGNCKGLDVGVDCARRNRINKRDVVAQRNVRTRRQATSADASKPDAEDAYDVVITFPATNDPVLNSNTNAQSSVLQLIQSIILEDDQFDVRDALPNVVPDPASLSLLSEYSCPIGKVVVGSDCVDCAPGTFYDRVTEKCEMCEAGSFSNEVGQVACKPCPEVNGRQGVTRSRGSRSLDQCHERCSAGRYYDEKSGLCRPCGYGFYQPDEGSFMCQRCDRGLTTGTKEAVSADECREECESGLQLSVGGGCEVCPRGTFRTKGVHAACIQCPQDRTTNNPGASSPEECALPICLAGTFLSETDNIYKCIPCPRGTFQPEAMQTSCIKCTESTSTKGTGSTSPEECTNPCQVHGEQVLCDANADCLYLAEQDDYICECKDGFNKTESGECLDTCKDYCLHDGVCRKTDRGLPYCECVGSFTGKQCQHKSLFAYIAGGVAGAVVFLIILVLLVWMICLRSTRKQDPKKLLPPAATLDPAGSQESLFSGHGLHNRRLQENPNISRQRFPPGSLPVLPIQQIPLRHGKHFQRLPNSPPLTPPTPLSPFLPPPHMAGGSNVGDPAAIRSYQRGQRFDYLITASNDRTGQRRTNNRGSEYSLSDGLCDTQSDLSQTIDNSFDMIESSSDQSTIVGNITSFSSTLGSTGEIPQQVAKPPRKNAKPPLSVSQKMNKNSSRGASVPTQISSPDDGSVKLVAYNFVSSITEQSNPPNRDEPKPESQLTNKPSRSSIEVVEAYDL